MRLKVSGVFSLEKYGKICFRAATARLGKYPTGSYSQIGV